MLVYYADFTVLSFIQLVCVTLIQTDKFHDLFELFLCAMK